MGYNNWKEYIVSFEDHEQTEGNTLHLHIDETGKIFRIYIFKDEIPELYKIDSDGDLIYDRYGEPKKIGLKIKPCINPLFVDLSVKQMLPFLHLCYFSEEDIENFEKETDMNLINAVKKYKNLYVN